MAVTRDDIDAFYRFATAKLASGGCQLSFDELVVEWESVRDRDEINAAIREGLADVDAGRHRPAEEVTEELRRKHGISSE